jgi:hypothetical protein
MGRIKPRRMDQSEMDEAELFEDTVNVQKVGKCKTPVE